MPRDPSMPVSISTLYVHDAVKLLPWVKTIQSKLSLSPRIITDVQDAYADLLKDPDPIAKGKHTMILTRNRGAFVKACPGTRAYNCCGYKILHVGTYCTMDCSYCILQAYFHPPVLIFFVNIDDMLAELKQVFGSPGIHRIGTGEFTDSLIWDPWTDLSKILVSAFSKQSSCALELKTKTADVSSLEGLTHHRKTIVAWSLNTPRVIAAEEQGSASLSKRLAAARRCQREGYPLAFHFDPLVLYEGCEPEYIGVLDQLFASVHPENIVWISLGAFRFPPELKPIIQKRHPDSKLIYGEFIRGLDQKMRYFKPLRVHLYREMVKRIRETAPETTVYCCMEDDAVWEKALGKTPRRMGGIKGMLDAAAEKICGLERR